jgi:hypothetical protein
LIVEGIVFRVVTESHPGCPKLAAAGADKIRTEFLANDIEPWEWALERAAAFCFPHYEDAQNAAKLIGPHCHARVVSPKSESLPERLRPRLELSAPHTKVAIPKIKMDPRRLAEIRRDPVEKE